MAHPPQLHWKVAETQLFRIVVHLPLRCRLSFSLFVVYASQIISFPSCDAGAGRNVKEGSAETVGMSAVGVLGLVDGTATGQILTDIVTK